MKKTQHELALQTDALRKRCISAAALVNRYRNKPGLSKTEIYDFEYLEMLLWENAEGFADAQPYVEQAE